MTMRAENWISVIERLPSPLITVLAYSRGSGKIYLCCMPNENEYNEHWHICEEQDCICTQPTAPIDFWMPLPSIPLSDCKNGMHFNSKP